MAGNPGAGTAQIVAALRLRANTISGVVSGLTRSGPLIRTQAPNDARASRFHFGADAQAQRLARMGERSDTLDGALLDLGTADRDAIVARSPPSNVSPTPWPDATPNSTPPRPAPTRRDVREQRV